LILSKRTYLANIRSTHTTGGGIIGCTTAYYLTRHPRFDPSDYSITIIEATRIANGASGKAGGLLASWAYPNKLAGLSFELHDQLAKDHDGFERWGYRRVDCGHLTAVGAKHADHLTEQPSSNSNVQLGKWWDSGHQDSLDLPDDLNWINSKSVKAYEEIADAQSTAQVHPLQFTHQMAKLAEQGGAKIVIGTVEQVSCIYAGSDNPIPLCSIQDPEKTRVVSITYTDKATSTVCTIPATTVVIATGPWTPMLLPTVRMSPVRAHSVTIKLEEPVSAYCLFTNIDLTEYFENQPSSNTIPSSTKPVSVEIYPRPNNEVYICSQGDFDVPLSLPTETVVVSSQSCRQITDAAFSVSEVLRNGQVTGRRACYLPTMDLEIGAGPLIGPTGIEGIFLATGHSCWGVSNAPATGMVISEYVFDGEVTCVEVGNLDPRGVLFVESGTTCSGN